MFTLHNGDCLEYMKTMPDKSVDAIVTDPPYGLGSWSSTGGNSITAEEAQTINAWDIKPSAEIFKECLRVAKVSVIWGGNHFMDILGSCRSPLVWDKAIRGMHFADGEMAWTSFDFGTLRILNSPIAKSDTKNNRVHPTQKPIAVMAWSIEQTKINQGSVIFDPFMGSGTTGVAAIQMGYSFIGCELSVEYFAIAKKRISSAVFTPSFFTPSNNRLHLTGGGLPATQSSFTAEVIPPAKLPAKSPRR